MPRGLRLFFLFNFFAFGLAAVPFEYFFFTSRGLSFEQFSWSMSIYYAVMVVCDVPAGVFADRFGRKLALIVGPTVVALGFAIFIPARSFAVFALGQAVTGIGYSFVSGTTSAFLYDTLKERGEEHLFLRLEGLATALRLLGTSLSFLLGGLLCQTMGLEASFWATVALTGSAGLAACGLREPKVHQVHPPAMREIFQGSFRCILEDRAVRWITFYVAVLFVWLRLSFHTYQAKFEEIGIASYLQIGLVYSLLNVTAALFSRGATAIQSRLGEPLLFTAMQACLVLSFAVLGLTSAAWAFLLFFLQQVPFGLHFPVVSNFVNRRIPSAQRTTILSFQSMVGRLAFSLFFPFFGWWEARFGLREAFLLSAWLGAAGMAWLAIRRPRE